MQSYYDILGLSQNASLQDIKTAFRRLAKLYHPDKNPGGKEKFEKILIAYEVLSDSSRRKQYDLKLKYNSVTQANKTTGHKKKSYEVSEEELKRRQYYQEYYKKQYQKQKEFESNKKIYNEYKYILFAAPIAVALFMFIINGFDREKINDSEIKNKAIPKAKEIKMGDTPYANYFKNPVYAPKSKKTLMLKNPTLSDAVVCLFTSDKTFVRSCYIENGYYAELSQLPEAPLIVYITTGINWNALRINTETNAVGGFDSLTNYYKSIGALNIEQNELSLNDDLFKEMQEISENDFFSKK